MVSAFLRGPILLPPGQLRGPEVWEAAVSDPVLYLDPHSSLGTARLDSVCVCVPVCYECEYVIYGCECKNVLYICV